ncbi:MAG: hypothetical protein D6806_15990 [Deltaproteobacteria bacterium]|nr:MAG: hypothetical protein D6806_15990 [Deltaproteobacteria bacterium]
MRALSLIVVLSLAVLVTGESVAGPYELSLEARPLAATLVGGMSPPAGQGSTYADASAGLSARLQVYFIYIEADFRHFMGKQFDRFTASAGYRMVFDGPESYLWQESSWILRAGLGLLVLGGPSPSGAEPYSTDTGFRAGGSMSFSMMLTEILRLEIGMELGFGYLLGSGQFGYDFGTATSFGLKF